ncbi:MAG: hypothetical protein WCX95_04615 [Candidatus Gracilibacteria bacterium]
MNKFTVFTVVLSIVVIVIVADLVVNNYLPGMKDADIAAELTNGKFTLPDSIDVSKALETNVLGADAEATAETTADPGTDVSANSTPNRLGFDLGSAENDPENDPETVPPETPIARDVATADATTTEVSSTTNTPSQSSDFEDNDFVIASKNVYLRDEQLKSAGFVSAYMEEEKHDGSLYKTIYTDDLYDVTVKKIIIKSDEAMFAKVYVIKTGTNSSIDEVYQVLKIRGAEGLESEINETNEYGDGNFYINDTRRPKTAFLTVKLGTLIYGFSYPKEYHSQVKNLIKLLEWEK